MPIIKETPADRIAPGEAPSTMANVLTLASDSTLESVFFVLEAEPEGLTETEVEIRRARVGSNEVAHEGAPAWYVLLFRNFANPFVLVLCFIGVVSFLTQDIRATVVIGVMVFLSVLMRFIQEFRSSRAAEQLRAMVSNTATVTRRLNPKSGEQNGGASGRLEVPFQQLVPGDIVHVSAGDMIPADLRLIASKDLFVSQSALTGESLPVEKNEQPEMPPSREDTGVAEYRTALDRQNLCFLGTNVVSGTGTGIVVATGNRTFFGATAKSVVGRRGLTSFDRGVNQVSWLLIRFMLLMVPVIFVLNGVVKHDWKEAFLFSVAVAVGLTPEMLPMVVTANLARGAVAMSRLKVIVKRLNAIQNLGAMNILCTDKTGTLTRDKIILEKHLDVFGNETPRVLEYAYLNSYYQTGLKNLLDRAILDHGELEHSLHLSDEWVKVDEVPFDFVRRRMSVIVRHKQEPLRLVCKGAVEELLSICRFFDDNGVELPLTDWMLAKAFDLVGRLNEDGMRVVAVGQKNISPEEIPYSVASEKDLVLVGFIAFLDPPKETAGPALEAMEKLGVQVKILTGDNPAVTRRICRDVGLPVERIVTGNEIERMTDPQLVEVAKTTSVFAKLTPLQKSRMVTVLQKAGNTVGFLGDGINDAAALRDADVGISVDTATDIAKESADIILLEKNLLVLNEGIVKGREVYGNIIKYIKMTASSNFGNMLSVLVASAFLPFLPMLPVQLLVQNLLYDFSQLSLPWDRMDEEFLRRPRRWEPGGIARFMLAIGPVSSVFDISTFLLMWFVFRANSPAGQSLFQSGWFIEGLISQTLIVHLIRTEKIPFLQSTASMPVILLTGAVMAFGIVLPFTPLAVSLGLQALPFPYFGWLAGTLIGYCLLAQIVKTQFMRRFGGWL